MATCMGSCKLKWAEGGFDGALGSAMLLDELDDNGQLGFGQAERRPLQANKVVTGDLNGLEQNSH